MTMTIYHLDLVKLRLKLNENDDIAAGSEIKFFSTCYDYEAGATEHLFCRISEP